MVGPSAEQRRLVCVLTNLGDIFQEMYMEGPVLLQYSVALHHNGPLYFVERRLSRSYLSHIHRRPFGGSNRRARGSSVQDVRSRPAKHEGPWEVVSSFPAGLADVLVDEGMSESDSAARVGETHAWTYTTKKGKPGR